MLSDDQLLYLNILMYQYGAGPIPQEPFYIKDYLPQMKKTCNKWEKQLENLSGNEKTEKLRDLERVKFLIQATEKDPQVANLRIVQPVNDEETGEKMACFVDESNHQAYAVFAGTGRNEWGDNFQAATLESSRQQEKALAWFNSLPEEYQSIYVSGHSKGGNKAMYCAVMSDRAGKCLSFDGEGFSDNFLEEHADQIKAKKDSIRLIASYRDYVHGVLPTIAGEVTHVKNDDYCRIGGTFDPKQYHDPMSLLKYKNGKPVYQIADESELDPVIWLEQDFMKWFFENASNADKALITAVLGELLNEWVGKGDVLTPGLIETYKWEAGIRIGEYFSAYLEDARKNDPKKYRKIKGIARSVSVEVGENGDWKVKAGVFIINFPQYKPWKKGIPFSSWTGALIDFLSTGSFKKLLQWVLGISGQGEKGRDFSRETLEKLKRTAQQVEDEPFWDITKWDFRYRIEQKCGLLELERCAGKVDTYFRKLIDINDASAKKIEEIFTKVWSVDSSWGATMGALNEELEGVQQRITAVVENFQI